MKIDTYPEDVIEQAMNKKNQSMRSHEKYDIDDLVLKVVGREEYLVPLNVNNRPLYQYTVSNQWFGNKSYSSVTRTIWDSGITQWLSG